MGRYFGFCSLLYFYSTFLFLLLLSSGRGTIFFFCTGWGEINVVMCSPLGMYIRAGHAKLAIPGVLVHKEGWFAVKSNQLLCIVCMYVCIVCTEQCRAHKIRRKEKKKKERKKKKKERRHDICR